MIAASAFALAASGAVVLVYTMGVFIAEFSANFGWSRAGISFALTCFTTVVFIGAPWVGRLADRYPPGHLAAASLLLFAALLWLAPAMVRDLHSLWLMYGVLALATLGATPIVLGKPVIATFARRRGLALGLMISGGSVGAFLAPSFVTWLIARGGWQSGYRGLAVPAVAAAIAVLVSVPRTIPVSTSSTVPSRAAPVDSTFHRLAAIAVLAGAATAGPVAHLVPQLRDAAVAPAQAALVAGVLGVAALTGRLLAGAAADRFRGGPLAAVIFATGAAGAAGLALGVGPATGVAVALVGFTVGAEVDLLAYMSSRYYGYESYGRVFGRLYGLIALGATLAPWAVGAARDQWGSYAPAFTACAIALVIAAAIAARLPAYPVTVASGRAK